MYVPHLCRPIAAAALLVSCASTTALSQRGDLNPEAASGLSDRTSKSARTFMVSAANPLAVEAGVAMLKAGGSAVDAAVAVQLVLNLVEPQSSGLGGGAFLLHWDVKTQTLSSIDGRETAPSSAKPDRFMRDGRPIAFNDAVHTGLSIGVPGTGRLLADSHRKHGVLPWADLFSPAIKIAEQGFPVSKRLHRLLADMGARNFDAVARANFFDAADQPRPTGFRLVNLTMAATLKAMRDGGADVLYTGPIAAQIINAIAQAPNGPGDVMSEDLAGYKTIERTPVCTVYRQYRICGMGPPSSGGLTVAQTLKILEPFDLGRGPAAALNRRALHLIAEAEKLSFADRDLYIADPSYVRQPSGLLDPAYIGSRTRAINEWVAMGRPKAGQPPGIEAGVHGHDETHENVGTSHISIIDAAGNAVSMTSTIEAGFGARIMVAGFLLNNEMTDFSFRPVDRDGRAVANAIAPGKRPRSSMAPTIVFDPTGKVYAVLGSPGGSRIILYVVKTLIAMIDWQLEPQAAAALHNFGSRGAAFELEINQGAWWTALRRPWVGPQLTWYALTLRGLGHSIMLDEMTSGIQIIQVHDGVLRGGSDPRREGTADGH